MKMQRGMYRSFAKRVQKKVLKYVQNYVKNITDEINVKSFNKYKYNFLFEFIGSFIFVFFISVYMLNSNQNEEYVIKHTKQINPYQSNDIFIPGDNLFDNEINNVKYMKDVNEQANIGSILLEQEKEVYRYNNEKKKHVQPNWGDTNVLNSSGKGAPSGEPLKEDNVDSVDKHAGVSDEGVSAEGLSSERRKRKRNEKAAKREMGQGENLVEAGMRQIINISSDTGVKQTDEKKEIKEESVVKKSEKGIKEELVKDVGKIIFKDPPNEYSKIKVNDINNIDLGHIDQYEILTNSKNKGNSNHTIYSFFGCLIYVLFVLLGAHINPAYTYALWLVEPKKYGFAITTFYVTFQYFGGILASILCAHMYGSIFIYTLLPRKEIMKTFLCEFISTFILTLILLSLYNYKKKFMEENRNEESIIFNTDKIKNMASLYSYNSYEDIYGYDNMFNIYEKKKKKIFIHIDNKYIKYIMNHIFYLFFIFFSLLFFVFVTNTTLNPMFSTSTLYTYLYFKFFQTTDSFNIYTVFLSFLSITKIMHLFKFYLQSLPLWIGPYIGSASATSFMKLFRDNEEETVNVIDTNVYRHTKKEKTPLINKYTGRQNAYLEEYNDYIHYNSSNYFISSVF
ncbi:aquaporin, putative [Plasmodium ovale]|uniref:Aquaporin, putative n=2 Tax=Plasmodium ovale TaxID=36330 RepID=A0A1A8WYZ9_PLAOA|nr:aquaporin, putative [Plasmodium ovale curtisi]SBS98203.1 aquaporin, putative [Plasmodium ovale curtisi]SCQ16930.1 aquaporin, putative [Plasmodium ovale]